MLRKTIALLPAAERPTFVRDVVQADPAMAALGIAFGLWIWPDQLVLWTARYKTSRVKSGVWSKE